MYLHLYLRYISKVSSPTLTSCRYSYSSHLATLWVPPAEADPHGVRGGREGEEDGHDGDGQGGEAVGVHGEGGVDGADYDSATDKFGKTFGTECSKIVIMSHNLRDLYY